MFQCCLLCIVCVSLPLLFVYLEAEVSTEVLSKNSTLLLIFSSSQNSWSPSDVSAKQYQKDNF